MNDINVPLLRKTLENITLNQGEWNQETWYDYSENSPCQTAGCLAGHAAVLSGVPLVYARRGTVELPLSAKDGRELDEVAANELGLNSYQELELFEATNSLSRLWSLAETFTHGEIRQSEMNALFGMEPGDA